MNLNLISQTSPGRLKIKLDLYVFEENGVFIVYSPALDLNGSGNTMEEAMNSFDICIEEYFSYTANKNTLLADLQAHGWEIKSKHQRTIKAPRLERMVADNAILQEILYKKDYTKTSKDVAIPA